MVNASKLLLLIAFSSAMVFSGEKFDMDADSFDFGIVAYVALSCFSAGFVEGCCSPFQECIAPDSINFPCSNNMIPRLL